RVLFRSGGVPRRIHQPRLAQHRAGARLVRGADDPDRRLGLVVLLLAIAEVAAQAALVRAAVGDPRLDAGVLEQFGDALDVLDPGAGENLPHRALMPWPARVLPGRPP